MIFVKLLSFQPALVSLILLFNLLPPSLLLPFSQPSLQFSPLEMLPQALVPDVLWSPMEAPQMWGANSLSLLNSIN